MQHGATCSNQTVVWDRTWHLLRLRTALRDFFPRLRMCPRQQRIRRRGSTGRYQFTPTQPSILTSPPTLTDPRASEAGVGSWTRATTVTRFGVCTGMVR